MRVVVHSSLHDLSSDVVAISKRAPREFRGVIREGIRTGNNIAKTNARKTAGRHGKHYPRAFTTEMRPTYSGGTSFVYSGEYGPDSAMLQGGMEFEWGSRNQPPHLDLNKSADIVGPIFPAKVGEAVDRLFW